MCQPCRQVSPWCRLPGKPFWRFRMWPPPRSSRRWPSSCPQRGGRFHPWAAYQFAAVFQKVVVGRIANLGITACGIDLHRPPRGHCRPRRCGPSSACCRLPPTAARSAGWRIHDRDACEFGRTTLERKWVSPWTWEAQADIAYRDSPGWPGWSSHRSAPLACFTIRAPTTMRAGLLPAPLCRFFSRLLYSCSILSQGRLSASFTQRLDLLKPERDSWSSTARDCGIGSSISCRFLLILTPKGNHFQWTTEIYWKIICWNSVGYI